MGKYSFLGMGFVCLFFPDLADVVVGVAGPGPAGIYGESVFGLDGGWLALCVVVGFS